MKNSDWNIKINYLYRDAGNYKIFGSVIFGNVTGLSIESIELAIRSRLIEGEYFIPEKWNIPRLSFEEYLPELDHDFHKFESIEETDEYALFNRDICDFLIIITL
jgi:hypothetical protein